MLSSAGVTLTGRLHNQATILNCMTIGLSPDDSSPRSLVKEVPGFLYNVFLLLPISKSFFFVILISAFCNRWQL